ncbi:hypothetical protein PoB_003133500, partial [Plakobranchus ocellatus]
CHHVWWTDLPVSWCPDVRSDDRLYRIHDIEEMEYKILFKHAPRTFRHSKNE